MRKRALGVALVVAVLLGIAGPAPGQAAPDRDQLCDPVWVKRVPAPRNGEIVLPVIVHYMKSTAANHQTNDVAQVFKNKIHSFFATNGFVNGTVWKTAGVRLFLHRIEACRYDPAFTGQIAGQAEEIPSPMAGSEGPGLFRRVNDAYNYRVVRGLDLYLWWEISGLIIGYARPYHLSSGETTTGAVWVDTQCLNTPEMAARCTRLLAHEAGHFLGLCHVCRISGDTETQCTACVSSFDQLPDCAAPNAPRGAIMRSRYDGKRLNACEVERAQTEARSRIDGPQ